MATWLNHVVKAMPRNGTTSHSVDPSSSSDVVAGVEFGPTTGRLLVCIVVGSVTSTTPAGWTLPAGGSAIDNTGTYLWYRVAGGGDTFSTTHNSSNYPVVFDVYEFAASSTFVDSTASTGVSNGGAGPTLSGLTGINRLFAILGAGTIDPAPGFFCTWSAGVKQVETSAGASGTDGYAYSDATKADATDASWSSSASFSLQGPPITGYERLVSAVNIGSDEGEPVLLSPQVIVP